MKNHFYYYNPNPTAKIKKDGTPTRWTKGDCAVRALAAASGLSWKEVMTVLCKYAMELCDMPNSDTIIEKYLSDIGFKKRGFTRSGYKPTINEFCEEHNVGKYVIRMSGHIVTIIDGMICDTWDCGEWKVRSYYSY